MKTMQEQVIRRVSPIGNGAHIFAPKEWVGDEVILVRKPKKSIRERILSILGSHLENIVGVYIYGSRARGEEEKNSDIDLFVVANNPLKIKEKGFEIIVIEEDKIKGVIKLEPVIMYSILSEAKPIMNADLLDKLRKKYKPNLADFAGFIGDTERIITITEEFLELSKEDYESKELTYPVVLRLRGVFILKQLLANKKYSHKKFRTWVRKDLPKIDYESVYGAYRALKNGGKHAKVKGDDLRQMLGFLKKEVLKLQIRLNGKKKKTSSKRN